MINRYKFKGYDLNNYCWRFGGFVVMKDFYYYGKSKENCRIIEQDTVEDNDIGYSYEVDPISVCQFIGKYDLHNNEIYEHDLVHIFNENTDEEDGLFEVIWDEEESMFIFEGDGLCYNAGSLHDYEIEIVENKYDKEVLKLMI